MRLGAYLNQQDLNPAQFGALHDPAIPRVTVRQWVEGTRTIRDPAKREWLAKVTDGKVTAADVDAHYLERKRKAETKAKRRARA